MRSRKMDIFPEDLAFLHKAGLFLINSKTRFKTCVLNLVMKMGIIKLLFLPAD